MKEALKELISSKDKRIKSNFIVQIKDIEKELLWDEIRVNIFDNSSLYKNIFLIKGEMHPTPKINDFLIVKEVYLNYSNNYHIKLYIRCKKIETYEKFAEENKIIETINISETNTLSYFNALINNNIKVLSSVFYIKDIDDNSGFYHLFNFHDLKEYIITINEVKSMKKGEYILINNFQIVNNTIITDNLTMKKSLEEEDFFYVLCRFMNETSDIFKILHVYKKHLILINRTKKLFKLEYEHINIAIGKIIYIANFNLSKLDDKFQLIITNKDTFIHISKDYLFHPQKINLNNFSCIKFIIKDYQKNNEYSIIKIFDDEMEIKEKEIYFIISTINIK